MAYSQTTWLEVQNALFDRLGDRIFWTNLGVWPEIKGYLTEALRAWNCYARFWRDRISFQTVANQPFYRTTDPALTTNPPALLNFTITDRMMIAEQQYHLLESQPVINGAIQTEPVSPTVWRGTDQFTLDGLIRALQKRRDQFTYETAITLRDRTLSGVISSEGRMELDETIADVRRASWVSLANERTHLWRQDEWASTSQQPLWNISPDVPPYAYSLTLTQPLRIQLIPPPSSNGQVRVLSVETDTDLNPSTPVLLGLPDDWCWAVKWGAMADLLGAEGIARDAGRAAYCEQRWQQALALAKMAPDILNGQINGVNTLIMSLQDLDSYNPNWENVTGTPEVIAVERDIVTVSPVPDAVYSVTLDVVRPAPIPAADTDIINLGPEILNAILDYAHHIASFKQGGAEFATTQRQFKNFVHLASDYNSKLKALGFFKEAIEDRSVRDEQRRPRREEVEVV